MTLKVGDSVIWSRPVPMWSGRIDARVMVHAVVQKVGKVKVRVVIHENADRKRVIATKWAYREDLTKQE